MSQYWQKTQALFSKIIAEPPLTEKYLKRSPPKFIFLLIKNTMEKTGFPKGLFTPEEETIEYFSADIENKKSIITKAIDITKLVTKTNFTIDIKDVMKGLEVEKTNIFLQYFYLAATINIDTKPIINKYLTDMKIKKESKENDKNLPIENIPLQKKEIEKEKEKLNSEKNPKKKMNEKKNGNIANKIILNEKNKAKGYIFWIDQNVYNSENRSYLKSLKENPLYAKLLLSFHFFCFDNLEDVFELLLKYINFKIVFIIISGRLYPDYYKELIRHIKFIKCLPICVIFTSDKLKKILIKRKKQYYLTDDIFDSINNSFYNLGGVSSNFDYCINFIINFYNSFNYLQNRISMDEKKKFL